MEALWGGWHIHQSEQNVELKWGGKAPCLPPQMRKCPPPLFFSETICLCHLSLSVINYLLLLLINKKNVEWEDILQILRYSFQLCASAYIHSISYIFQKGLLSASPWASSMWKMEKNWTITVLYQVPESPPLSRHMTLGMFLNSFNFPQQCCEVSTVIIPILKMRKLRHNEVNSYKGHMSGTVISIQNHYSFTIPCYVRLKNWPQSFTTPCPYALAMPLCSHFHQKVFYFPTS